MNQQKLPASTYLLTLAQTINLTMAVLSVSMSALVGLKLAPNTSLGTIPYGLQFAAVMLCTYIASMIMQKKGRAFVFYIACLFLFAAGICGYFAVSLQHFSLLCVAHILLGVYIACANFYRFAATDNLDHNLKAKAISFVIFGGVLAAIMGPFLAQVLKNVADIAEFALCYGVMSIFAILNMILIFAWQKRQIKNIAVNDHKKTSENDIPFSLPIIISAILTGSVGYLVMNLLMIQSSLIMKSICSFDASSAAIRYHVLAMFLPSFFTGKLIARFGVWKITHISFILLAIAAIWGIYFIDYNNIVIELLILGLGWNFSYVAGSSLLAIAMPDHLKHKIQGINDTLIALSATIGAFLPSILYSYMGWKNTHIFVAILCIFILMVNLIIHYQQRKYLNHDTK
jgi:MFS family permease